MFEVGKCITTNGLNAYKIVGVNHYQICVKNLRNGNFVVFDKTEHAFELLDIKEFFKKNLSETLTETDITNNDKEHVENIMNQLFSNVLTDVLESIPPEAIFTGKKPYVARIQFEFTK